MILTHLKSPTLKVRGTAVAQWLRCCAGSIPACVSGFFTDIKSFRSHYGPGVDSASNRNEYQEYFLGSKGGRCVRLTTYHHPVPLSRNLGTLTSWNSLGHPRPVMGLNYLYTIRNVLKQREALLPLLIDFALEFVIRKVQVNQDGLKLNGTFGLC